MFLILGTLWFIRTLKYFLFWLYLWQLKEYHVGRFLDHFDTSKGKKLIFNPLLGFKIVLAGFFLISPNSAATVLIFIYFIEAGSFLKAIYQKDFKKPVMTSKASFLMSVLFLLVIIFPIAVSKLDVLMFSFCLLIFDILLPFVVSLVVLLLQPFAVLARNSILKKAKKKMEGLKDLTVIAITGSFGKTSTKEFLKTILSKNFITLSTNKRQNSEIGIANCILNDLGTVHKIFIAEIGAYNKGKIKEVCSMLKPEIGIITGVNEQHLALFGSMDNLLSAEGGRELAKLLPKNGMLVINGDNKYALDLYKRNDVEKKIYSINRNKISSDIWTEDVDVGQRFISFVAFTKNSEIAYFKVDVLGRQNVQNILGAVLVAQKLGMSLPEIAEACKSIKQEQAGMVLKTGKHGIEIIDSSYSSNPDGAEADLDYLKVFPKKKAVIMPCLIELGPKSAEIHEKIGRKIGQIADKAIITTKERFESIKKGAMESGMAEKDIIFCENPKDIFTLISLSFTQGDAVLLEGRVPNQIIKLLLSE